MYVISCGCAESVSLKFVVVGGRRERERERERERGRGEVKTKCVIEEGS